MSKYRKYSKRGWFNESYRHSLASKGIKTSKRLNFAKKQTENNIQQLITQAQQEALTERKERIGFSRKDMRNKLKKLFTDVGWIEVKSDGIYKYEGYKKGKYARIIKVIAPDKTISYDVYTIGKHLHKPRLVKGNITKTEATKVFNKIKDKIDFSKIPLEFYSTEIKTNYALDLEDPTKHKFGSVEWQDSMLYNILEKRRHNEELSPIEKTFLEVHEEHMSRINYQQLTYEPTTVQITEPPTLTAWEKTRQRFTPKPGWVGRGLEAEKQLGKKVIRGTGKVAKGFLATVALGLAGDVDGERPYQYRRPKTSVYGTSLPYTDNPILPIPPHNRNTYDVGFSKRSSNFRGKVIGKKGTWFVKNVKTGKKIGPWSKKTDAVRFEDFLSKFSKFFNMKTRGEKI